MHVVVGGLVESDDDVVELEPESYESVVSAGRADKVLKIERLY